jgi:formylglycine-generating enzyme required for sulfatase activity
MIGFPLAKPCVNCADLGVDLDYRVLRGGSWGSSPMALRAANRAPATAESWSATNGFRCARDLKN